MKFTNRLSRDCSLMRDFPGTQKEFCTDNLLVQIHLIIEMIWWTGLALEVEFPFTGSLVSTFLVPGIIPEG